MDNGIARRQVRVGLGDRGYDILIGAGLLASAGAEIAARLPGVRAAIVADDNVAAHHLATLEASLAGAGIASTAIRLPAGEKTKSFSFLEQTVDAILAARLERGDVVIALGGGVIGDLAGFAAATFMRGLPFLQIPTTLLADVDSSVGGKVGINHPRGKNLIGAFHQPVGVFIETNCLSALPERDFRSGLAEVVKYGVILDAEFFAFLERNIHSLKERDPQILREVIARCCRLKADVVEADEFERSGLRAVLNYGHTFAHAYEALCGYGQLTHGEAVSIGMMDAACLARALGRVDDTFIARQRNLLSALGLPLDLTDTSLQKTAEDYLACMKLDKKTVGGQLRFVLPTRLGHVEMVSDVPEILVKQTLNRVRETP